MSENYKYFKDCEFRFREGNDLFCKNKSEFDLKCDNCMENIHLNCSNYNGGKDYCLKFFKKNISSLKQCQEKTTFSDKELSRKWSN